MISFRNLLSEKTCFWDKQASESQSVVFNNKGLFHSVLDNSFDNYFSFSLMSVNDHPALDSKPKHSASFSWFESLSFRLKGTMCFHNSDIYLQAVCFVILAESLKNNAGCKFSLLRYFTLTLHFNIYFPFTLLEFWKSDFLKTSEAIYHCGNINPT